MRVHVLTERKTVHLTFLNMPALTVVSVDVIHHLTESKFLPGIKDLKEFSREPSSGDDG